MSLPPTASGQELSAARAAVQVNSITYSIDDRPEYTPVGHGGATVGCSGHDRYC